MKKGKEMKYAALLMMVVSALFAQAPIPLDRPQFRPDVEYKQGSFTIVIIENRLSEAGGLLVIGSTSDKINSAVVSVFYYAVSPKKTNLLLSQTLTCPVVGSQPTAACLQPLRIRSDSIQMIRIEGMTAVETAVMGKP